MAAAADILFDGLNANVGVQFRPKNICRKGAPSSVF
jgi:hypothetical protein